MERKRELGVVANEMCPIIFKACVQYQQQGEDELTRRRGGGVEDEVILIDTPGGRQYFHRSQTSL